SSDIERFADSAELSRERDVPHYGVTHRSTLRDNHEHLLAAYEQLSMAEEALRMQHEAIAEAQRLLEVERNRYRTLFNLAPDPYLVTDESGTIEEANAAAAELFG